MTNMNAPVNRVTIIRDVQTVVARDRRFGSENARAGKGPSGNGQSACVYVCVCESLARKLNHGECGGAC